MTNEIENHVDVILLSVSEEDLVRLISGIDRPLIVDLLRRNPKLHNQLFPGFRPHRAPQARVPTRLAHYAHGDMDKMRSLLEMWLKTNESLCQMVAEEVSVESLEDDVAGLLVGLGLESRDRLLWALLLDEREEVQAALVGGLQEALTNESSALMIKADHHRLVGALEEAHQEIADLRTQLQKLKDQNQLLRRKVRQVDELQAEQQRLLDSATQAEAQRQEATSQRDTARQEVKVLQAKLVREQAQSHELQQSVDDLKASLEAAIVSQQETAGEVKRRLDETLATLEEARRENAKLRLEASRLKEERNTAYNKRDEEQARAERLATQLERLKYDKEVLIDEKRELHRQLEQTKFEVHKLRENLTTVEKEHGTILALPHFDEAWNGAVNTLAHDLLSTLPEQEPADQPADPNERWDDWWGWQQMEAARVRPLLELSAPVSAEDLVDVERVQKLLALRWYLLEWLKLSILEALRDGNLTVKQAK